MRCTLVALCCWLLAGSPVFAQQKDSIPRIRPNNSWFIKLSPFSFLESDGGIAFTGEYVLEKSKLGLQLELQPIFFSTNTRENAEPEAPVNTIRSGAPLGIKLRPEIRFYPAGVNEPSYRKNSFLQRSQYRNKLRKTYIAIDFLFKYTQRERLSRVDVSNGGVGTAFQQLVIYTDKKLVLGGDVKVGSLVPLSHNRRWFAEWYIGLGIRYKKYSYTNLPTDVAPPARRRLFTLGNRDRDNLLGLTRTGVSLPAGLKIVYRL